MTTAVPTTLAPTTAAPTVAPTTHPPVVIPPPAVSPEKWAQDRNLGPWRFFPQMNKWGYLNNPRWRPITRAFVRGGPDDYDGRESEEPQIYKPEEPKYPSGTILRHHQCGHWHKPAPPGTLAPTTLPPINYKYHWWYQPSIAVEDGKVAFVPTYNSETDPDSGFAVLRYDVATDTWCAIDYVTGIQGYGEPHAARYNWEGDIFYYIINWPYNDTSWTEFHATLYVYKHDGTKYSIDIWSGYHWGPNYGIPYDIDDVSADRDCMDCVGGEVVCLARVLSENAVDCDKIIAKMSHDYGVTFPDSYEFVHGLGWTYASNLQIRASSDGTFWVLIRSRINTIVQVWKSNVGVTAFSKVWERDVSALDGGVLGRGFDVSDDASFIVVTANNSTTKWNLYISTDGGTVFNIINLDAYIVNYVTGGITMMAGNSAMIFVATRRSDGAKIPLLRSTDGGNTWSEISNPSPLYFVDMNKRVDEYVMVDCEEDYNGSNLHGFLYSDDAGATWRTVSSPLPIVDVGADVNIPSCY